MHLYDAVTARTGLVGNRSDKVIKNGFYVIKNAIVTMKSLGLDPGYAHRKLIAEANNIAGYVGTAAQNTQMYNLLVTGILKKE